MSHKHVLQVLAWGVLFLQTGCAGLTYSPKDDPVIQDSVGDPLLGFIGRSKNVSVFSMTPERRTVLVMFDRRSGQHPVKFCAEPPADVAENIASSMRGLVEAQIKAPAEKGSGSAAAELSRTFSSSIVSLFYRSQGIQMLRDGLFNLCQAYINKAINDKEYISKYDDLVSKAFVLVSQEIPSAQTAKALDAASRAESAHGAVKSAVEQSKAAQAAAESAAARAEAALDELKKLKKKE
jgi:hypothetical protein